MTNSEKIKVLITAKTYPLPSASHLETVCTAGVREDGSFIRLYPIDYRYRPFWQWYKKYQWIELEVERNEKDPRPESYRPVPTVPIKPLGEPLPTAKKWAERQKYVLAKGTQVMCRLNQTSQSERSLGIVRPSRVSDVIVEEAGREWKPEWQALFQQQQLFGPQRKPLEKIPYKFSYVFKCEAPACPGHTMMIEDWEIGQLYRAMREKHGSEQAACEKVRHKLLVEMCAADVDTHFFVGTVLAHGTWVIIGVFWPKK